MSTDLEQLLRDAAPAPRGECDLEALYRRGLRRRKVRSARRVGGAVASIAAIVAMGLTALPRSASELPPIAGTPERSTSAQQAADGWLVARDGETVDADEVAAMEPYSDEPLLAGGWEQETLAAVAWSAAPEADVARPAVSPGGATVFAGLRGVVLVDHGGQRVVADHLNEPDVAWWDADRWVVVGLNDLSDAIAQIVTADGELVMDRALPELPGGEAIGTVLIEEVLGDDPVIVAHAIESEGDGDLGWELPSSELEDGAPSWTPRAVDRRSDPGSILERDGLDGYRLRLPGGGAVEIDLGQTPGPYELDVVVLDDVEPSLDRTVRSDPAAGEEPVRFLAVVVEDRMALARFPGPGGEVVLDQDGSLWSVTVTEEDFAVTPIAVPHHGS